MSWSDNFPVYVANLSPVYLFSVLVSIVALITTIIYQRSQNSFSQTKELVDSDNEDDQDTVEDLPPLTNHPLLLGEFGGIAGKIKAAKQKALLKTLHGDGYSDVKDEQEKRAETEQLEAIWELLKKQEDKFQVGSMQEMQEQLRLYRYAEVDAPDPVSTW